MAESLRCCPRCRLLQSASACVDCGAGTCARDDAPPDLLFDPQAMYVDVNKPLGCLRGMGALLWVFGAIFLGGMFFHEVPKRFAGLAMAALMVLVFGPMLAFGVFSRATARRLFRALAPPRAEGGPQLVGRLRAQDGVGAAELVRYVVARTHEQLYAHRRHAGPLLVEDEQGRQVAVTGIVHVLGPGEPASREAFGEWAECVPPEASFSAHTLGPGELVEVSGHGREEQIAEGYRDRKLLVLHGDLAQPVLLRRA